VTTMGAGLLPLGIPMGRQAGDGYGIRAGGRFWTIDAQDYAVWSLAHAFLEREALVAAAATVPSCGGDPLPEVVKRLENGGFLVALVDGGADEWGRLRSLRPVPRGLATGWDGTGFVLRSPESTEGFRLSPVAYLLWSFWDGGTNLEASVVRTVEALQRAPSFIRACAIELVASACRAGLALFDGSGGG
jgi:hypothetical protein